MRHRSFSFTRLAPLALALAAGSALASPPELACQAMLSAGAPRVQIQQAEYIAEGRVGNDPMSALSGASASGAALPAHCRVQGNNEARTGAD